MLIEHAAYTSHENQPESKPAPLVMLISHAVIQRVQVSRRYDVHARQFSCTEVLEVSEEVRLTVSQSTSG